MTELSLKEVGTHNANSRTRVPLQWINSDPICGSWPCLDAVSRTGSLLPMIARNMRPLISHAGSANPRQHGLPPDKPYALAAKDVLAFMHVSVAAGLTSEDVRDRVSQFGPNKIASRRKAHALLLLLHQFRSPVVYLLSAAAGLAFYFGELKEGSAIAVVLAVNALIGFVTELKAARSIEGLRALGMRSTRVRRDGHVRLIPAAGIVPGDIVVLEAGDYVSADLRLVEASNMAADKSTLTGESVPVEKHMEPVPADARLADRASMLFKGTAVTRGSGVGVAVATGLGTEIGRVSQLVEEAEPGSSPIEKKLARTLVPARLGDIGHRRVDRGCWDHHRQGSVSHCGGSDRACSGRNSGGIADSRHAGVGAWYVANGAAKGAHRAAIGGRDIRRNHHHSY